MSRFVLNPAAGAGSAAGLFSAGEYRAVAAFHAGRTDAAEPTPLRHLPNLAASLGIGSLLVKDESTRLGLTAFKILGVTYAVACLRGEGAIRPGATLACATAGNHGRAVARAARDAGLAAVIYVPRRTVRARVDAIASEGARVIVFDGTYDEAVQQLPIDAAREGWTIVSDTSWPGYEQIPRWIMAGYTHLMMEAAAAWPAPPDVILVQAGVGGLACAVASWSAAHLGRHRPSLVVCEPTGAACLLESARRRQATTLAGPLETTMAGLCCAAPSPMALGPILDLADAFVAIDDRWTFDAMRRLANPLASDAPVRAGPSGACGLGALLALCDDSALGPARDACRLGPSSRVLVINTEGVTDPALWHRVTGDRSGSESAVH